MNEILGGNGTMKIYTKTGDKGQTSLYDSTRVDKDSLRVESYGTIDELNSNLGFARNFVEDGDIVEILYNIQRELFDVAGELATKDRERFPEKVQESHVGSLEKIIDTYLEKIDKIDKFIIPGSNKASAVLHVSRTICRRAERRILTLSRHEEVSEVLIKYVNRLSDVIYTLARYLESELKYVEFKKPSL
jgi:cob(I)alamin adenosyltransferase